MNCTSCATELKPGAKFCNECGAHIAQIESIVVQESQKRCKYCSESILETARICRFCNRDQSVDERKEKEAREDELLAAIDQSNFSEAVSLLPQSQQAAYQAEVERQRKSTGIAYLLYFLLGGFGAHKFYIRERDWGLAYLIPTIINIPMLIAFFLGAATTLQNAAGGFVLVGLVLLVSGLAVGALAVGILVDLFCIPMQVSKANDRIRKQILIDIARRVIPNCPSIVMQPDLLPRVIVGLGFSTLLLLPICLVTSAGSMAHLAKGSTITSSAQTAPALPATEATDTSAISSEQDQQSQEADSSSEAPESSVQSNQPVSLSEETTQARKKPIELPNPFAKQSDVQSGTDAFSDGTSSQPLSRQANTGEQNQLTQYEKGLDRSIKRAWFPPVGHHKDRVVVSFNVSSGGDASDLKIEEPSENEISNQAALKAVENASPFRPLPADVPGPASVRATFDYNSFSGGPECVIMNKAE